MNEIPNPPMSATPRLIERFTFGERLLHWLVAVPFVGLLLSGLAFSYPSVFWLTFLFGGGANARRVHDWLGLFFAFFVLLLAFRWAREMVFDACDRKWLRMVRYYGRHEDKKMPDCGKYNGGQKMYFWVTVALALVFLVSGLVLWFPQGSSAALVGWMRLVHFAAAILGGVALIGHIYLAAVAYPGTGRGMTYGKVSRSWAMLHHPAWLREKTER
jgi:formate dehydrogenase subunit gamma